jgi:tetratricopeptide (TPR) repeat protein
MVARSDLFVGWLPPVSDGASLFNSGPQQLRVIVSVIACSAVILVTCSLAFLWLRNAPLSRWKVWKQLRTSQALLAKKQYAASLESSTAAASLAFDQIGRDAMPRMSALLLAAAARSLMGEHEAALGALDDVEEAITRCHGQTSAKLLPCLHARAEVLMASRRAQLAIAALDRVREIQRIQRGDRNMAYATACYEQASALVRYANDAPTMVTAQRAALVERAVELVLEASAAATASFDAHEGDELAEALLGQILDAGGGSGGVDETPPNRLARLPACEPSIRKLRAHLQDHFEHFGGDERAGGAGDQSSTVDGASTSEADGE